jgi:hypothetical protein
MDSDLVITPRNLEESSTTRQQLADFLCVTHSRICQLIRSQKWRADQYIRAQEFLRVRRERFADEIKRELINV